MQYRPSFANFGFFKKVRIYWFIAIGGLARYRKRSLLLFLFFTLTLFVCVQLFMVFFLNSTSNFTEGMVGKYTKSTLPSVVENLASFGLTKLNTDGDVSPAAAKSWDLSQDGKTYTFYLRDDLYWSDGAKFTANDLAGLFEGIQTKVVNQTTVQFTLANRYSPFPTLLTKPLFRGSQLAGLGSYKFDAIDMSGNYVSSLRLIPRSAKAPKKQAVSFRFYPNSADLLTAYRLGELKAAYGFFSPGQMTVWPNAVYHRQITYTSDIVLLYNNNDKLLNDKTIRQALTYAIPRDNLPGELALSPIPPTSWAFNPNVKQYIYDTNHAMDLLKKRPLSTSTELTITTTQPYLPQANMIAEAWTKIGVKTNVAVASEIAKSYQVALVRLEIPPDPDQYTLWHSLQKQTNLTGYGLERIDKLLEDGRAIADKGERRKKYLDFQRFLVEDTPAAFLYYPYEGLLINKKYDTPFTRQINGFGE